LTFPQLAYIGPDPVDVNKLPQPLPKSEENGYWFERNLPSFQLRELELQKRQTENKLKGMLSWPEVKKLRQELDGINKKIDDLKYPKKKVR